MTDEIIIEMPQRINCKAGYRILEMQTAVDRNDGVYINSRFFKTERIIAGHLRKAERVAPYVVTLGIEADKWIKQLQNSGESVMSFLVDTIASHAVEKAADLMQNHIEREMTLDGYCCTNRYSPGYCKWQVSEQHLLFALLPKNFCGIRLNESAMMTPLKSTSGIIGIGHQVKKAEYTCEKCGETNCVHRAKLKQQKR